MFVQDKYLLKGTFLLKIAYHLIKIRMENLTNSSKLSRAKSTISYKRVTWFASDNLFIGTLSGNRIHKTTSNEEK
jgi:hypothetical protein